MLTVSLSNYNSGLSLIHKYLLLLKNIKEFQTYTNQTNIEHIKQNH